MKSINTLPDSSEMKSEPKSRSLKPIIIVFSITAFVIIVALAYVWLLPNDETQTDWLFKGAYCIWGGKATDPSITLNYTIRVEIVDFNSTHIKSLSNYEITSQSAGVIFEDQDTLWEPIDNWINYDEMEGYTLQKKYEDNVFIEGLGTYNCYVYEFTSNEVDVTYPTVTVYIDPEKAWPYRFNLPVTVSDLDLNFVLNLKETNVSGLT